MSEPVGKMRPLLKQDVNSLAEVAKSIFVPFDLGIRVSRCSLSIEYQNNRCKIWYRPSWGDLKKQKRREKETDAGQYSRSLLFWSSIGIYVKYCQFGRNVSIKLDQNGLFRYPDKHTWEHHLLPKWFRTFRIANLHFIAWNSQLWDHISNW